MLNSNTHWRITFKRWMTSQHLKQDNTDRINIRRFVCCFSFRLLRRQVVNRSHHMIRLCHRRFTQSAGNSEISDLDFLVVGQQYILRLDISMNDHMVMGITDSTENLLCEENCFINRQRPVFTNIFR